MTPTRSSSHSAPPPPSRRRSASTSSSRAPRTTRREHRLASPIPSARLATPHRVSPTQAWARRVLSALSGAEKSLLRDTQPALTAAIATLLSSSELVGQDLFRLTTHLLAVKRT